MAQSLERMFDDEVIADVPKRKNKPKKHPSESTHADIVNSAPLGSKSFESMLSPACRPIASMVSEDAGIAGSVGGTEDWSWRRCAWRRHWRLEERRWHVSLKSAKAVIAGTTRINEWVLILHARLR